MFGTSCAATTFFPCETVVQLLAYNGCRIAFYVGHRASIDVQGRLIMKYGPCKKAD